MEKKINAKSKPLIFFKQYLTILQPIYNLTSRETDVLSYLLYLNYKYKNVPEEARNKIILDYDSKVDISNQFDLNMPVIYNIISSLRKKKYAGEYFLKGKKINKKVPLLPYDVDKKYSLIFNFEIENEELEINK